MDSTEGSLSFTSASTLRQLAVMGALFLAALVCLRLGLRWLLRRTMLSEIVPPTFQRYDALTYLPFAVFALGAFGLRLPLQMAVIPLLGTVLLLQAGLLYGGLDRDARRSVFSSRGWLAFLFFLSGFAALIYQIIWQRVLFASFGVNIESVTVVVSLFMFGLGIGSLVGGVLSKWFPRHAALLFLGCEVAIGAFGLASIPLIQAVSAVTLHGSLLTISLTIYLLLSLPTICMGATLPILVGYLNRHYDNVGKSVGLLYCINTFGSAVACFVAADVLFLFLGQQAAIVVAALCNFLVAALVYAYIKCSAEGTQVQLQAAESEVSAAAPPGLGVHWGRFVLMLLLAAAIGYISLSQEILSVPRHLLHDRRAAGCLRPNSGVHARRHRSGHARGQKGMRDERRVAPFLHERDASSGGAVVLYLHPSSRAPVDDRAVLRSVCLLPCCGRDGRPHGSDLSSCLPLLHPYPGGSRIASFLGLFRQHPRSGRRPAGHGLRSPRRLVSGAQLLVLGMATLLLAGCVCVAGMGSRSIRAAASLGAAAAAIGMVYFHAPLFAHVLERLHWKDHYRPDEPYKAVVQNRSGIIAIGPGPPDAIYGGGVYDGRFSTDPVDNQNGIRRAYMIPALHPCARSPGDRLERRRWAAPFSITKKSSA